MNDRNLDVVGIGNAIVDALSRTDDAFLEAQDMAKGAMTLIDGPHRDATGGDGAGDGARGTTYLYGRSRR